MLFIRIQKNQDDFENSILIDKLIKKDDLLKNYLIQIKD
jgi:hypothetical protein